MAGLNKPQDLKQCSPCRGFGIAADGCLYQVQHRSQSAAALRIAQEIAVGGEQAFHSMVYQLHSGRGSQSIWRAKRQRRIQDDHIRAHAIVAQDGLVLR